MTAGLKGSTYEQNKEVAPGITSIATPGHTPGHTSFVVGYHFPYPCVGYVEKDGTGYRLVPVAWDPNG